MKKTIFPLHLGQVVTILMSLFLAGFGIYMVAIGLHALLTYNQYKSLVLIISGFVTMTLFSYVLIYILHNRIILKDEKIIITGHWILKNEGLQFPDEIVYDEIKNIAIICANANSLKRRIKRAGYSSLRPFIYYEVLLKNGESKWIYIECFSKKQRKIILNVINKKVGLNLSYDSLERKDYSIYKKNKK